MGKKGGGGGAASRAGGGLSAVGLRGGGGGTAADTIGTGSGTAGLALAAWFKYGKYVVRPIARAIYGNQKKYKVGGVRVGAKAYRAYQQLRRANAVTAAQAGTTYIPPTEAEWRARAEALKRPKKAAPPPPPPKPPPPSPPRGPTQPRKPLGGPGSIRGQIFSYVVANGIVWAITKTGEWLRQRAATAEEIRTGKVAGRTAGGGPRRGPGKKFPTYRPTQTEALTPIQIFQKRLPVPRYTVPKRAPVPKTPALPQLEPVVITAQRLPVPVPVKSTPTWLKILKAVPAGTNPLSIFQGKKASKSARQLGRALTALETVGVQSALTQTSSYSNFGGGGNTPGTKRCECKPKRKRKPKEPRTVCYTGTYTERADGLTKLKRRKVPCRSSRKK